jgi:enoyl-CoA hydratase/carnithine racemase
MLGENIGADEALNWGLVEKVVEAGELDDAVEAWLCQLDRNGPLAVRRQKALIRTWENVSLDQAIRAGVAAFGASFDAGAQGQTEPAKMMGAFFQGKGKSS